MTFKKILAAIDYSPLGQSVFEQALDLAKLHQAELMLFHCLSTDVMTGPLLLPGELGLSSQMVTQAYQTQRIHAEQQMHVVQQILQQYCKVARQQGVTAQFQYQSADAGRGICQAAKRWEADLVLVGRRGRKGLAEALLGSVSNYVLHHAPCAVLVLQCNQPAAAEAGVSAQAHHDSAWTNQPAPSS